MERPETRYVAVGDADVAYQVLGDHPIDLLFCYGLGSHIEWLWDAPGGFEFGNRCASFARFICFDRRGTGASDGVPRHALSTWEEWAEDLGAVLDAAGSKQAAILATLDAGGLAIPFAAMHPERVRALILLNTAARYSRSDDYPVGMAPEVADAVLDLVANNWGSSELSAVVNPHAVGNDEWLAFLNKMVRSSATPRTAVAQYGYILREFDARQALPLIQAPTLVLHVRESPLLPIELGRYLADNIEGAKFVDLPGGELGLGGPMPQLVGDEVAEFLTGVRPITDVDRVLTTIMFSDIVRSTEQAATLGDHAWRGLLDSHDRVIREQFRRFRGREINTTGDGFVASFDGPARAIRCATVITEATDGLGIGVRTGLHTGECEIRGDDLSGLAVHIAARIGAMAGSGQTLVSGTVKDLVVGSGIDFDDWGEHELKGVPGSWKLFAVRS